MAFSPRKRQHAGGNAAATVPPQRVQHLNEAGGRTRCSRQAYRVNQWPHAPNRVSCAFVLELITPCSWAFSAFAMVSVRVAVRDVDHPRRNATAPPPLREVQR